MNLIRLLKIKNLIFLLFLGLPHLGQAMVIPIEPEFFSWEISGELGEVHTLVGPPIPASTGDAFSISLEFMLDEMWQQCSPCESTGDVIWRGEITAFSVTIGDTDLVADIGSTLPNYAIFSPGDDPSENDTVSLRLGNQTNSGSLSPLPLHYDGGVLDAAFNLFISDWTGTLFEDGYGAWHDNVTIPAGSYVTGDRALWIANEGQGQFGSSLLELNAESVHAAPEPHPLTLFLLSLSALFVSKHYRHRGKAL